jgi:hypothetical protein
MAQQNREAAVWISLRDAREQLLEAAEQLEALAETEEREVGKVAPIQSLKPKA